MDRHFDTLPLNVPLSTARLEFDFEPQVRRDVHRDMAAHLAPDQPKQRELLRRAFAERDFVGEFEERFGDYGLRPNDLGDVATAHCLVMWSVVHDAPIPPADEAEVLRRQVVTSAEMQAPSVSKPRVRQTLAESLLTEMMVTLDAQEQCRRRGDDAALADMADRTRRAMRTRRGIDLSADNVVEMELATT